MAPRNRPRDDDDDDGDDGEDELALALFEDFMGADADGDGRLSPAEAINQFVANNDVEGLVGYLNAPHGEWTPEHRAEVEAAMADLQESNPEFYSVVNSYAAPDTPADQVTDEVPAPPPISPQFLAEENAAVAKTAFDESVSSAHQALVDAVIEADQQGGSVIPADLLASVAHLMPEGANQSEWEAAVLAGVESEADAAVRQDQEAHGQAQTGLNPSTYLIGAGNTPIWLLQATGYGELTEQQQERLVDYFNDLNGTNIRSYEELVASGVLGSATDRSAPSALVQRVVEAAILAQEPVEELRIELPGVDKPLYVSKEQQGWLRDTYGLSTDGITRLARLGSMTGQRRDPDTGEIIPLNLAELALVASYYGMQGELSEQGGNEDRIAELRGQLKELQGQARGPDAAIIRAQMETIKAEITSLQQANVSERSPQDLLQRQRGAGPGILGMQGRYYRGLSLYGQDQEMALIHVVDSGLARRIADAGRDPEKLTAQDNARAWDILIQAGSAAADPRSGLRPDGPVYRNFNDYYTGQGGGGAGGGGGGGGRIRRIIDPEAVKQQVRGLWQGLFLSEAPDEAIQGITAALQKSLDNAPEGMEFDVSARIQDWLRGQSVYGELYGAKPAGLSEQDYQAQFLAGSASILGNEAPDVEAVQEGMRGNDYQATVGSAFASGAARGNNSTLQERLARAANIVAANT